jgi:hypothetical protein
MAWLLAYLANPAPQEWSAYARVHALFRMDPGRQGSEEDESWVRGLHAAVPAHFAQQVTAVAKPRLVGRNDVGHILSLWSALSRGQTADGHSGAAVLAIDDSGTADETVWRTFLQWSNLIQFVPVGFALSRKGIDESAYAGIPAEKRRRTSTTHDSEEWNTVGSLVAEALRPLLGDLEQASSLVPVVGFELTGDDGSVVAEAELAWEPLRVALVWSQDDAQAFTGQRWDAFLVDSVLSDPHPLMDCIGRSAG